MTTATTPNSSDSLSNKIHLVEVPEGVEFYQPQSGSQRTPLSGNTETAEEPVENNHWFDPVPSTFTESQRSTTTILFSGLTVAHDFFIQSAFTGVGYTMIALDVPDTRALQYGREYGNRGQCNPTYFTVGNLVKYLIGLRDQGMSIEDIIDKYVFATIGSCGPCRFGTYVTEYRKALRDAGFEGFRVILFEQTKGISQATGENAGLDLGPKFITSMVKGIFAGDVINALTYRIRPYEVEAGATNKALANSKKIISEALCQNKGFIKALLKTRKEFSVIEVDRTKVKPKVSIIGEFWAMTTEGDGNYHLQSFLEEEGAEVEVQPVTAWIQYLLWAARYDTLDRSVLKGVDAGGESGSKFSLEGVNVRKRILLIRFAEKVIPIAFKAMAILVGLKGYKLPNMDTVADVAHDYYDNNLRGGEGHMEVGKLILNVRDKKADMTLSVKPFGCMPSSGVSDGVQAIITEKYPDAIFLPIETTGDGAVNVYSRIQMQLFKAKKVVEGQVEKMLETANLDTDQFKQLVRGGKANKALYDCPHIAGCTTVNVIHQVT